MAAIRNIWECLAEEPKEPVERLSMVYPPPDDDDDALPHTESATWEHTQRRPWRRSA